MSETGQEETRPRYNEAGEVIGHETFTQYRDRLLVDWQEADKVLKAAKEAEMQKRMLLLSLFQTLKEGVNNMDLGGGWKLKLTHNVNYKLDKDRFKVAACEDAIKKAGNIGPVIVDELLKHKTELGEGRYKKLDPTNPDEKAIKEAIDAILTTDVGAPKVEIVPPKELRQ